MKSILDRLRGGDRRMVRGVDQVIKAVRADPELFDLLIEGMMADDPLIRMRAADAVEKISAEHPEYLRPHKKTLLKRIVKIEQQEVRWHVAQLLPRLPLTPAERRAAVKSLNAYLFDKSSIVKTFAMQALSDLAGQDPRLRPAIVRRLERLTRDGSPAMKSRERRLLAKLKGSTRT
jgi:HEAT repeat protein